MQSPSFPRYLVPPRSKYSPQHHVLKHPQLPFLSQCQRPSFTPIQKTGKITVLYILIFQFLVKACYHVSLRLVSKYFRNRRLFLWVCSARRILVRMNGTSGWAFLEKLPVAEWVDPRLGLDVWRWQQKSAVKIATFL